MEVKEAERNVGCLVQVSRKDYNFGGMVFLLAAAWREVSMSGTHDYGVTLRDTTGNGTLEMKINGKDNDKIKAFMIDLIPYNYPNLKYKPEYSSPLTATEIMSLLGSVVAVDNESVWLKRVYKAADEYRHMRFEVDIQELVKPYIVRRVQLKEITRYTGEPPELPTGQNEKIAPIRQRQIEKEKAEAGINEAVEQSKARTLEHLRKLAAKC